MDESMESRRQQAIEQVTGDVSLTENMTDKQAAKVLDWGTRAANWLTVQPIAPEVMDETLDDKLQALRRIIRRIDNLMEIMPGASQEEISELLAKIFEPLADLEELLCQVPPDLDELAARLEPMQPDEALSVILTILNGEITTI